MRRLFSLVFGAGGLVFLTPLAAPDATAMVKAVSVGIALAFFWGAWKLWRPKPRSSPKTEIIRTDAPPQPAVGPTSANRYAERRALLKAKRAFEDLKHLVGVPGLAAKQRTPLILADEGLQFTDPKTGDLQYLMRWGTLLGVETTDSESDRTQGQINSVRTGAIARGTTLGGAVALETVGLFLDKSPLILKYRIVPNDPMVSVAVLSTWLNDEIAKRILAYRTELVAAGKITFDAGSVSE
jgi:hypothetical protein